MDYAEQKCWSRIKSEKLRANEMVQGYERGDGAMEILS
jgi:hypothetical protein